MATSYRFGVSEFTTWPWSFERDVERYPAHGIDVIEICEFKLNRDDYCAAAAPSQGQRDGGKLGAVHRAFTLSG